MKKYNLIFLNTAKLFLSSKKYNSWREIQAEYEHYSASLEFDSLDDVIEYIVLDYKLQKNDVELMLSEYIVSNEQVIELKF